MPENLGAHIAMGIVHLRLTTCESLLVREEESFFQRSMQTDDQFFDGVAAKATNGKLQPLTLGVVLGVPFAVGRSEYMALRAIDCF
ncbi:MAG: hypothetical protein ACT4PN_08455 [Nitrospiraceae bacterium]